MLFCYVLKYRLTSDDGYDKIDQHMSQKVI